MAGQIGRLVAQAVFMVVIARTLGVHRFGALVAIVALVSIASPFVSWGAGHILVRDVARDPQTLAGRFGSALRTIVTSGLVVIPLIVAIAAIVLDVPLLAVALIALGDAGFARVSELIAQAFQALDRLAESALVGTIPLATRAVAAVAFALAAPSRSLVAWSVYAIAAAAIAAALSYRYARARLGAPRFDGTRSEFRLGAYFAVSACSSTVYADIDKTMLGSLATLDATGVYGAADRAINMTFSPVMALCTAAYARYFRAGSDGIASSLAFARRLVPITALYSAGVGVAILLAAPLAPIVLGSDYEQVVPALRWLAAVPLLRALYYLPADALTGAGRQGTRTLAQIAAAVLNIVLNLLLIPAHSWRGAAWSTLAALAFLDASLWLIALRATRGEAGHEIAAATVEAR